MYCTMSSARPENPGQGSYVFYKVRSPYEVAKRPEGPGSYVFYEVRRSPRSPRGQDPTYFTRFAAPREGATREAPTVRRRVKGSYSEGRTPRLRMGPDEGMPPQA